MKRFTRFLLGVLVIGLVFTAQLHGQQGQSDDVIRVRTELVQTDVTVVDKRGRFVNSLSKDDFELRVDSKLQPLSLFEEVLAGSVDEEKQIAAARKGDAAALARLQQASRPQTARGGRVIFFFVDDVHLTSDALARARQSSLIS